MPDSQHEVRMTGWVWLQLAVDETREGTLYRQRAIYFSEGLIGRLYWWGISPFHALILRAMDRNIIAAAREPDAPDRSSQGTDLQQGDDGRM